MPPETREGVRLTPLKARIFDVIWRAGVDGVMVDDINAIVFHGQAKPVTIRNHIRQINESLAEVDLKLDGSTMPRGFYRVKPIFFVGSL